MISTIKKMEGQTLYDMLSLFLLLNQLSILSQDVSSKLQHQALILWYTVHLSMFFMFSLPVISTFSSRPSSWLYCTSCTCLNTLSMLSSARQAASTPNVSTAALCKLDVSGMELKQLFPFNYFWELFPNKRWNKQAQWSTTCAENQHIPCQDLLQEILASPDLQDSLAGASYYPSSFSCFYKGKNRFLYAPYLRFLH